MADASNFLYQGQGSAVVLPSPEIVAQACAVLGLVSSTVYVLHRRWRRGDENVHKFIRWFSRRHLARLVSWALFPLCLAGLLAASWGFCHATWQGVPVALSACVRASYSLPFSATCFAVVGLQFERGGFAHQLCRNVCRWLLLCGLVAGIVGGFMCNVGSYSGQSDADFRLACSLLGLSSFTICLACVAAQLDGHFTRASRLDGGLGGEEETSAQTPAEEFSRQDSSSSVCSPQSSFLHLPFPGLLEDRSRRWRTSGGVLGSLAVPLDPSGVEAAFETHHTACSGWLYSAGSCGAAADRLLESPPVQREVLTC